MEKFSNAARPFASASKLLLIFSMGKKTWGKDAWLYADTPAHRTPQRSEVGFLETQGASQRGPSHLMASPRHWCWHLHKPRGCSCTKRCQLPRPNGYMQNQTMKGKCFDDAHLYSDVYSIQYWILVHFSIFSPITNILVSHSFEAVEIE